MTAPVFTGIIDKGKLILDQPQRYLVHLANHEGKKVELVLRKRRTKRSDSQNRYYWGVCVEILANHCGYEPEELHEALKVKFLSDRQEDENGLMRVRSTAKLTTDEFIAYTNRVVRWAAESLGVYIPSPNEVEYSGWQKAG
jgi:hypothetical protein